MGLFGFGNNRNIVRNNAPASEQGAEWQFQGVEFRGSQAQTVVRKEAYQEQGEVVQKDDERRRRKITAAILTGLYDQTPERARKMGEIISTHDARVSTEQYDALIGMMAKGQVGRSQGREVIAAIQRPIDAFGPAEVFRRIEMVGSQRRNADETKHIKRILGSFSGAGFNGYNQTSEKDILTFLRQFPDAMSFDHASEDFLNSINNGKNSPQKVRDYYDSMNKFKDLMYGNEQKYLNQYKAMERQAIRRKAELEKQRERLVIGHSEKQVAKNTVKARQGMLRRAELLKPGASRQSEYEIDLIAESGWSEDACLSLPEQGVFALFDGAGGVQNGKAASRKAREVFASGRPEQVRNATQLARMMETMNEEVQKVGGVTTGVLAKVNQDKHGNKYLSYASVGDSRLYILHKNGRLDSWTKDEGVRNRIWNALGISSEEMQYSREVMGVANKKDICLQYRDVLLNDGDRVIMCSDGITGDNPPEPELGRKGDLLSDQEVKSLASAPTAEEAAENLLVGAKKIDDRSVIVFDV